jgi:hypothetical protein
MRGWRAYSFVSFDSPVRGGVRMVRLQGAWWSLPVDVGHTQLRGCHLTGRNRPLDLLDIVYGCREFGATFVIAMLIW